MQPEDYVYAHIYLGVVQAIPDSYQH